MLLIRNRPNIQSSSKYLSVKNEFLQTAIIEIAKKHEDRYYDGCFGISLS